jgi:D-arabinose 1-dehydrogenase-like Zn-dependent alcohol dehydrogenase
MGFRTVAIARGGDKEEMALKLGAWRYIDNKAKDPAVELTKLGGARVVLSTITDGPATAALVGGVNPAGTLLIVGIGGPMSVTPGTIVVPGKTIRGFNAGVSREAEDTLSFSALTGVRSINQVYPLERIAEAWDTMMSGRARFRGVLAINTRP